MCGRNGRIKRHSPILAMSILQRTCREAYTSFIVRFSPDIYAAEGVAIVDAGLSWNAYNLERIGRRRWINIEVDDVRTLVRHADLAPDTPDTPSGQPYNRWLNRNTFQAGERDGSYAIREAVLTLNVRDSEGADFAEPPIDSPEVHSQL